MFSTENVNVFNQCRGFMKNIKKSLKISEVVNGRRKRSYKRKRTKRQTTIFNISHRKLKIEYHEPHKNWERTHVPRKDDQFLLY